MTEIAELLKQRLAVLDEHRVNAQKTKLYVYTAKIEPGMDAERISPKTIRLFYLNKWGEAPGSEQYRLYSYDSLFRLEQEFDLMTRRLGAQCKWRTFEELVEIIGQENAEWRFEKIYGKMP